MAEALEELVATLGLEVDESAFEHAFEMLEHLKLGFGAIAGIAAAAGSALLAVAHSTMDAAVEAERAAQRSGTTAAAFQELSFAAEQSEISADTLQHSLVLLSRQAFEAARGGKEAAFNFQLLGVSVYGSNGQLKPTDQLLGDLADRFSRMPDGIKKTALAQQVLGRSGADLLPLLNKGRAGISELRQAAYDYGVVIDDDTIQASKRWEEQQKRLMASLHGLRNAIGSALIKQVGDLTDKIANWIRENRELIAGKVMDFLQALRQLAEPLIKIIDNLFVKTEAWKYSLIALAAVFAFMNLPLLAIIAALLLIEDFYAFLEGKDSLIGSMFPKGEREAILAWLQQVRGVFKYFFSGQLGDDLAKSGFAGVVQGMAEAVGFKKGGGLNELEAQGIVSTVNPLVGTGSAGVPMLGPNGQPAAPNVTVNQTINAAPGMDEKQIADQAAHGVRHEIQKTMREGHAVASQ